MFPFLSKAKDIALDVLFPPVCLQCQRTLTDADSTPSDRFASNGAGAELRGKFICQKCYSAIKLNNTLFCPVCRARLAENKRICSHKARTYTDKAQTDADKKQPQFSYLLGAAGHYDDPILQNLIHYFKYKHFKDLSPVLGDLLIKYIENCGLKIKNFIAVPVPLHSARERERGFNQAKLIALEISKYFNLPLADVLERTRNNKAQVGLKNNEERFKNIKDCFAVKNPETIKNKNILLVDDVFTSGATMNEAVRVLKNAGARQVIAIVLAKA